MLLLGGQQPAVLMDAGRRTRRKQLHLLQNYFGCVSTAVKLWQELTWGPHGLLTGACEAHDWQIFITNVWIRSNLSYCWGLDQTSDRQRISDAQRQITCQRLCDSETLVPAQIHAS